MNIDWSNEQECLEAVKENGLALKFVNTQTPEICLEAVKQYGCALAYVSHQTPEMCLEAVKRYGCALAYVIHQTPEIVARAIVQDPNAKECVRIDWTEEIEHEILFLTI